MANTDNPNGFKYVKGTHLVLTYQVAANQTITAGDAVVLDEEGKVAIATPESGSLLGVAMHGVTTGESPTAKDTLSVCVGTETTIFSGQCSGESALSLLGTNVDIEGTTGIMEVDEDASAKAVIRIVELDPESDIGENGRVHFIIVRSQYNGFVAAL